MKKFIKWLTNKSKIVRIIRYIYRGSYVTRAVIVSAKESLIQTQEPDHESEKITKVIEALETCVSYLNVVNEALEKILEWVSPEEIQANNVAIIDTLAQTSVEEAANEAAAGDSPRGLSSGRGLTYALEMTTDKIWNEIN